MTSIPHRLARIGTYAAILVLLCSCSSSPPSAPRYYQLSAQAPVAQPAGKLDALGVGPIIWPEYLDRRQVLTRVDAHTLKASDSERWAEPLESSFSRVLRENLARLGAANRVITYPWNAAEPPTHSVRIEVLQFDSDAQGTAMLRASWRIEDGHGAGKGADQVGEWHNKAADTTAAAAVAAQGTCLAQLAAAINKALTP